MEEQSVLTICLRPRLDSKLVHDVFVVVAVGQRVGIPMQRAPFIRLLENSRFVDKSIAWERGKRAHSITPPHVVQRCVRVALK